MDFCDFKQKSKNYMFNSKFLKVEADFYSTASHESGPVAKLSSDIFKIYSKQI